MKWRDEEKKNHSNTDTHMPHDRRRKKRMTTKTHIENHLKL